MDRCFFGGREAWLHQLSPPNSKWFIDASISRHIQPPSLARASTYCCGEREKTHTHTHKSFLFVFVLPNPRQPRYSLSLFIPLCSQQQLNASFVWQKLIPAYVSTTKCLATGSGNGGGGGWRLYNLARKHFYRTFGAKKKEEKRKKEKLKRQRRPRGLKQLIQDPDVNSPIL